MKVDSIFVALVENPGDQGILAERYRIRAWTADPDRAHAFRTKEGIDTVEYVLADHMKGYIRKDSVEASIADSLKRIADAMDEPNEYGEKGPAAIAGAICRGLRGA